MTMLSNSEIGHWNSPLKLNPEKWFGFIYCIENKTTNQFYLGKKQFWHGGKKKSRTYGKPMAWKNYTGSSSTLNSDIDKYGKINFEFDMIDLYKTKGGLYYAEAYLQMLSDSMTEYLSDGSTPRFYNRQIAAIRFVPKEPPSKKTKSFISKIKKRYIV